MRRNKQIQEKYLYFAITGGTETLLDDAGQAIQLTTSTTNPVPPGTDAYAKGVFTVSVTDHADHQWGTYYGTPTAGDKVEIHPSTIASYHASNGTLTFSTLGADAVYGFTVSGTAGNNDYVVLQKKPIDTIDCMMYPASRMTGIQMVNATSAIVYFESVTGDVDSTDQVLVTFASGKYKDFCQTLNDAVSDNKRQSNVIDVADVMSGTFLNRNPATISAVAFTLDT
tara:strand:- start:47 stop:724 length:678 start_codon:yes stop_codon:yes gene_type:complete